jgi:cell division protein FtsX
MTVVKLREEALQHEGLVGVHVMSKEELIAALAPRFGIDLDAITKAARVKFATDKTTLKQEIHALKGQRDVALAEHDRTTIKQARQQIKKHKRTLRRLAEQARATAR